MLNTIVFAMFIILSFSLVSIPNALAHYPTFPVQTTEDILDFCEFYYDEYLYLGIESLNLQHPRFPNLRACAILYDHIAWESTHPARNTVLIAEIEKYLGESSYLKERHLENFDSIPDWIIKDTQFWVNGFLKDSHYAYGIRALLENNVLSPTVFDNTKNRDCNNDGICIKENDFLKYSHKDSLGNIMTERFLIKDIASEKILVRVESLSKEKKSINEFYLESGSETSDNTCCITKKFAYSIPLEMGGQVDEMQIVSQTNYPINGINREGFVAQNPDKSKTVILDKQTGIMLSEKIEETDIITNWTKSSLVDTNVFEQSEGIQYHNMNIPKWWKTCTMWYIDGNVSESEYLQALEYLIDKNILRV